MANPVAGRDLDALVAEKVMGWTRVACRPHPLTGATERWSGVDPKWVDTPPFSTDIAAAMEVPAHLRCHHFELRLFNDGIFCELCLGNDNSRYVGAYGGDPRNGERSYAECCALAICLAALRAVDG